MEPFFLFLFLTLFISSILLLLHFLLWHLVGVHGERWRNGKEEKNKQKNKWARDLITASETTRKVATVTIVIVP